MRKITKFTAVLTASVLSISTLLCLNENKKAVAASNIPKVKLDNVEIYFPDTKPYINLDNRTLVPVRFVSQALGCIVDWEESNELVTITKGTKRILLKIGQNWAIINDTKMDVRKEFDTKAVLKDERTMVPLRFISEALGAGVAWDEINNTVIIRSDGVVEPVATPAANGGWTVGEKPDLSKKQIVLLDGVTLDIALSDPIISKLMELKGTAAISYNGAHKEMNRVQYNEFHKDGAMDVAMVVEYTRDMKNVFFEVERDSKENRERLKSALGIIFSDSPEMQKQIYDQIVIYKNESKYLGYDLNETYEIFVKKNTTTWSRDDDSMGVWCKISKKK